MITLEEIIPRCSVKKGVLRNFAKSTGKHLRHSLLFNKVADLGSCNFIKKETPTKVFSCEFRKIFINTFFTEHPGTTATANVPFARGYSNEILA